MNSRNRFLAGAAALAVATLLSACVSPEPDQAAARLRDPAAGRAWIDRRAAELRASGLSDRDAHSKAEADFSARYGYSPDTYTVYDSEAKARAEQQKINEGLEKLQRDK
ncbi:MAG: hypothetical protein C0518_05660 [Opitutus sp.]|nr:hypothetical protein [Opitutus sp.]